MKADELGADIEAAIDQGFRLLQQVNLQGIVAHLLQKLGDSRRDLVADLAELGAEAGRIGQSKAIRSIFRFANQKAQVRRLLQHLEAVVDPRSVVP